MKSVRVPDPPRFLKKSGRKDTKNNKKNAVADKKTLDNASQK